MTEEELLKKHEELNKLFKLVEGIKKEWERTLDCAADMIILIDGENRIKRCNRALKEFTGKNYNELLRKDCRSLLEEHGLAVSSLTGKNVEIFCEKKGSWFVLDSYPFVGDDSSASGNVIMIHDDTERKKAALELAAKNRELEETYAQLEASQIRIMQQEKMASIGQLAAGVAHEINNPVGFIASNLGTLKKYAERMSEFIEMQTGVIISLVGGGDILNEIQNKRKQLKLDHILADQKDLISESLDGADRVKRIVQDLKSFSHVGEAEQVMADINLGLESTINIAWNELKYKVKLRKEYGEIPLTRCNPGQLNQVFMNILINAAQAINEEGDMTVKTWHKDDMIHISIADTGCGIAKEEINRIFDPFFTTKEVGKGTGLGLSISYDIIKKHGGNISVESEEGRGSNFTITIPVVEGK